MGRKEERIVPTMSEAEDRAFQCGACIDAYREMTAERRPFPDSSSRILVPRGTYPGVKTAFHPCCAG